MTPPFPGSMHVGRPPRVHHGCSIMEPGDSTSGLIKIPELSRRARWIMEPLRSRADLALSPRLDHQADGCSTADSRADHGTAASAPIEVWLDQRGGSPEASLTMRLVRLVVPIARHDCA
jgi:hypothetical protein